MVLNATPATEVLSEVEVLWIVPFAPQRPIGPKQTLAFGVLIQLRQRLCRAGDGD